MARIYISSTYSDLKECREAVAQILRSGRHEVIAMEDYVAADQRPLDKCLADVERCDIYVGIFAWRYGFVPGSYNPEQKSITELEYRHAVSKGIRCLIFLLDENAPWPRPQMEQGAGAEKLKLLRDELSANYTVSFFRDREELAKLASVAVANASGQGHGDDEMKFSTCRLPITGPDLFGRDEQLAQLDAAWEDPKTHIVSLVAWGGVGKSALVNRWLALMAGDKYRGAARVYGWSFYDPGRAGGLISAAQFVEWALERFGDPNPSKGSPWEKGERLAKLVGDERALLVLDGLEPLQHPPGPSEGRLKDQALQAFLPCLAARNRGLCVITTRFPVANLESFEGSTHVHVDLEHLPRGAGAQLLRKLGVKGRDEELEEASGEFGGHPLALTLLGCYLSDARGGDVARRKEVRALEADMRHGDHAKRVMDAYAEWFANEPELIDILSIVGLFNRPADRASFDAVRKATGIPGYRGPVPCLTDKLADLSEDRFEQLLAKLRRAKLLAEVNPEQPGVIDAHPLVREHFGQRLKSECPDAWREGNRRLFYHLRQLDDEFRRRRKTAGEEASPRTVDELAPLYAAVIHGCHAGYDYHRGALNVYYVRIQEGQRFSSANKLVGSVSADLDALRCFFPNGWEEEPDTKLEYPHNALLFGQAGYRLWMVGRLKEAIRPMKKALAGDSEAAEKARDTEGRREASKYASIDADTLAGIHLVLGDLSEALRYSEQGVRFARDSSDANKLVSALNTKGDVYSHRAEWDEAKTCFLEAEEIKKAAPPSENVFHNPMGHRYCDMLLHLGRYDEALEIIGASLKAQRFKPEKFNLIDVALSHLLHGRALLAKSVSRDDARFAGAKKSLDRAMTYLRHAGRVVHLPRGLTALAQWHLVDGSFDRAHAHLSEACDIATRTSDRKYRMELHEADCLLASARVHLAQGHIEKAGECFAHAKEIVGRREYRKRDGDVREIEEQLRRAAGG
ncbi:MAG TPA: DUF4062 domain-containing protein [Pyrinomonadaceae bacterium]|nr:DUF4062 domain-containing protein [Pyrinomonadaceae bacterium]